VPGLSHRLADVEVPVEADEISIVGYAAMAIIMAHALPTKSDNSETEMAFAMSRSILK
jgi:hypothetical protein